MLVLIPESFFSQADAYVYLYSRFGEHFAANAGYEEWGHRPDGWASPEPVSALLLILGAASGCRKIGCGSCPATTDLGGMGRGTPEQRPGRFVDNTRDIAGEKSVVLAKKPSFML
jgi:hypothetical protein